ncbi:MAG: HlyD family efflux transporter periplasmic adaptor subunit [Planctomycetota bacterium]
MLNARWVAVVLVLFALMGAAVSAAEKTEGQPAEPKTHTVEAAPLKIEVSLDGVFESEQMTEVSRVPETWDQMKVLWAAGPGTAVKKGDVLVKLDTEDLDKTLEDIEAGTALGDLALKKAQEELRLLEKSTPEQLKWAERSRRIAQEDHAYYLKSTVPYQDRYFALDRQGTDLWLESVKTELRELKKMYEADDLVESTEELVLKRQQHEMDRTLIDVERQVKFAFPKRKEMDTPRANENEAKKVHDADAAFDNAKTMLPLALREKQAQVDKMKYDRANAAEHLAKLKADRETMVVRAPAAGTVYYGQCVRGWWTTIDKVEPKLREGGQLGPREVFMTIVDTERMFVRAGAAEQHLRDLRKGMTAVTVPTGYPDQRLAGQVESVTIQPGGPEKYTVRVSFKAGRPAVLPGMTCQVRLVAYEQKNAIMVPAGAVFAEPDDADKHYVYLQAAAGKPPVKRPVTAGREKDGELEIVKGLAKGDVILLEKPDKK